MNRGKKGGSSTGQKTGNEHSWNRKRRRKILLWMIMQGLCTVYGNFRRKI